MKKPVPKLIEKCWSEDEVVREHAFILKGIVLEVGTHMKLIFIVISAYSVVFLVLFLTCVAAVCQSSVWVLRGSC